MSLKELPIKISYRSKGDDNIVESFLIPALKTSVCYKRSVGFFSSTALELLQDGIYELVHNNGSIQIICSPELTQKDIDSIKEGYAIRRKMILEHFENDIDVFLEDCESKNLSILSELISSNRLNIKVVDIKDENTYGMYHDKIGLLEDNEGNKVLFVGSPNESENAYTGNYEKIRVSRSWFEGDLERIEDDEAEFDEIWEGKNPYIERIDCTDVVAKKIDWVFRVRKEAENEKENSGPISLRKYQKQAIEAWINNNMHGFYVMATGTGKTWTAIYSALEVIKNEAIFLVICAPYKHLVRQWYEDVHKVLPNCRTVLVSSENNGWEDELLDSIYDAKYNVPNTVIAISTIVSFNLERFQKAASKTNMKRMLIVDEAHRFKNLSPKLQEDYSYMLGLSATPSSKRNDESAKQLMDFFGGQVFNLPIEYAIEKGYLVHYEYHPIYVEATLEEEAQFDKLTTMMMSCFKNGVCIDVENLSKYKRARLRVISMASQKTERIDWILSQIAEENHFIVYCGDGRLFDNNSEGIRHIQFIKETLTDKEYKVSQFTAEEDMKTRMQLVDAFNKGMIDSMVAIRCLDEGINIPSIQGALLLSSNDDYREFVQRRGRILRTYTDEYTGSIKEVANIYDVIVLPSDCSKNFATIELRRFYEYARLANNQDECMRELEDLMYRYGIDNDSIMEMEELEDELDE